MPDYGPLKPLMENAGFIVAAGAGIVGLVVGKAPHDPPVPARRLVVRFGALLCGLAAFRIWKLGQGEADTSELEWLLWVTAAGATGALLLYAAAYFALCVSCPGDQNRYVKGFKLRPQAKAALGGDLNQPSPYGPIALAPTDQRTYFCNSGKNAAFLWIPSSVVGAQIILVFFYVAMLVLAASALSAASILLLGPDVTVETRNGATAVDLPADILFEFGKAELRDEAEPLLERAAQIMHTLHVREASVVGYTDSLGATDFNEHLSHRRASAVYFWLKSRGTINDMRLRIIGRGAADPRAPNSKPDGSDNSEGRAQNRRVEILFDRRVAGS